VERRRRLRRERIELLRWTQCVRHPQLSLSDHVHELDPGKSCRSRSKGFETQHWSHHSLDGSVILFDNVVQILVLTDFDIRFVLLVEAFDRRRVGAALVDCDLLWNAMLTDRLA
jgi:hypothetical protein